MDSKVPPVDGISKDAYYAEKMVNLVPLSKEAVTEKNDYYELTEFIEERLEAFGSAKVLVSKVVEETLWSIVKLNEKSLTEILKKSRTDVEFIVVRIIETLRENEPELEHLFPSLAKWLLGSQFIPYLRVLKLGEDKKDLFLTYIIATKMSGHKSDGVEYVRSHSSSYQPLKNTTPKFIFINFKDFDNILGVRLPHPKVFYEADHLKPSAMLPMKCSLYCGDYVKHFWITEMGTTFTSLQPAGSLLCSGRLHYTTKSIRIECIPAPTFQPSGNSVLYGLTIEVLGQMLIRDESRLAYLQEIQAHPPDPLALGFHRACFE